MITSLFVVVEGLNDSYPNYGEGKNRVTLSKQDPSQLKYEAPFLCSPIFSYLKEGVQSQPEINNSYVGLFIVPSPFPNFAKLEDYLNIEPNQLWFSLGLSNLIIFSNNENTLEEAKKLLSDWKALTACEFWEIKNESITSHKVFKFNTRLYSDEVAKISEHLKTHERFIVSEYIISVKKILNEASKYTPHYLDDFNRIFKVSNLLIEDLCFLRGDKQFTPTPDIKDIVEKYDDQIDDTINDVHSRIVQINSSLSYVYNQVFSGSFPTLSHLGIVRRHSLFGVGSAVNALFEILSQLEEAFATLDFEEILSNEYGESIDSDLKLFPPTKHDPKNWQIIGETKVNKFAQHSYNKVDPESYFKRLSFFSGRLGFREYDFTATAATQVLVESESLEWNVINYTHEILHNHVRLILNELLDFESLHTEKYEDWIKSILPKYESYIKSKGQGSKISYRDFFTYTILTYCIYSEYLGSLSQKFDLNKYNQADSDKSLYLWKTKAIIPSENHMLSLVRKNYRDVSEIFVHILDLNYVYQNNIEEYTRSIWNSWGTVSIVNSNISHYILRTLLVIAAGQPGDSKVRYTSAASKLVHYCDKYTEDSHIFKKIAKYLDNFENNDDLRFRFCNSILITDLADCFFSTKLQEFLTRNDQIADNKRPFYEIEFGSFEKIEIISKVRYVLEQLFHAIDNKDNKQYLERDSAWILIVLSSYYD